VAIFLRCFRHSEEAFHSEKGQADQVLHEQTNQERTLMASSLEALKSLFMNAYCMRLVALSSMVYPLR
jgi:hypothetical protein